MAASLRPADFFVIRTPLLPLEELTNWSDFLATTAAIELNDPIELRRAWDADRAVLRERLKRIFSEPTVNGALFVASSSLWSAFGHWVAGQLDKKGQRIEHALTRYFQRMAARCTPFGLFAGCSLGRVTQGVRSTRIAFEGRHSYSAAVRLDFDYLFALTERFRTDVSLRQILEYRPTPTLRQVGARWHYLETRVAGALRSNHLVRLDHDDNLDAALKAARSGTRREEVARAVTALPGNRDITLEEALNYVDELINNGVLISSLYPIVTGDSVLADLIQQLERLGVAESAILERINEDLSTLQRRALGAIRDGLQAVEQSMAALPNISSEVRFQVDMTKGVSVADLSDGLARTLTKGVEVLCLLDDFGESEDLSTFRDAFVKRYERAWVPLIEVLDEEAGIGFGVSGTDSAALAVGLSLGRRQAVPSQLKPFQEMLLARLLEAVRDRRIEVEIPSDQLAGASRGLAELPTSFSLQCSIIAKTVRDFDDGTYEVHLKALAGPSGGRLLGRFCHTSTDLKEAVRRHLQEEESTDSDSVFAEIVFLPEGRLGNILCRPVLRSHEIVCLGRSGAPADRQLTADDLLVTVEANGEIVLYSKSLQKRIVPRLTSAHGFMNPKMPPLYRFLCGLQNQRVRLRGFSWGALDALDYLPRVRSGRYILSLAQWRLTEAEVKTVNGESEFDAFLALQTIRRARSIPRWVSFVQADNVLPVDFDNALSVAAFLQLVKPGSRPVLKEMYPPPSPSWVEGPEGTFAHEIVLPMIRRSERTSERPVNVDAAQSTVPQFNCVPTRQRVVAPGDDWLFVKLYGGPVGLDEFAATQLPELVSTLRSGGELKNWFFIRYRDPNTHLRMRFAGSPAWLMNHVLASVLAACRRAVDDQIAWSYGLDSYQREIERYGGRDAIGLIEAIFCADSEATIRILPNLTSDEGANVRWRIALKGLDELLSDFSLDISAKHQIATRWKAQLQEELGANATTRRQLAERFRSNRSAILSLNKQVDSGKLSVVADALRVRSAAIRESASALANLGTLGKLTVPLTELLGSLAHMHVNRMMRSISRADEMVLYDFLSCLYQSEVGRLRAADKSHATTRAAFDL